MILKLNYHLEVMCRFKYRALQRHRWFYLKPKARIFFSKLFDLFIRCLDFFALKNILFKIMNSSDNKVACPTFYVYSMHGFSIFFSIPLHLVMFYCVLTKTSNVSRQCTKMPIFHLVSIAFSTLDCLRDEPCHMQSLRL